VRWRQAEKDEFLLAWSVEKNMSTRAKTSGGKAFGEVCGAMREELREPKSGVFCVLRVAMARRKFAARWTKKNPSTCAQPNASKGKKIFSGGVDFEKKPFRPSMRG
jgi:hypothetical protein